MKILNMVICERGNRGCFIFKSTSKFTKTIICVNIKNTDTNKSFLPLIVDENILPIDKNYTVLKNCVIYKGTYNDLMSIYDPAANIKKSAETYALESCCSKIKLQEQQDLPIIEVRYKYVTSIKGELYECNLIYYSSEMHFDEYLNYDRAVYKYITAILLESGVSHIYMKSSKITIKENNHIRCHNEYKAYSEDNLKRIVDDLCRSTNSYVLYDLDEK